MKVLQTHNGPQWRSVLQAGHPLRWLILSLLIFVSTGLRAEGIEMHVNPADPDKADMPGYIPYVLGSDGVEITFTVGDECVSIGGMNGSIDCWTNGYYGEKQTKELHFVVDSETGHFSIEPVIIDNLSHTGLYDLQATFRYGVVGEDSHINPMEQTIEDRWFFVVNDPEVTVSSSLGGFDSVTKQVFTGHTAQFNVRSDFALSNATWIHVLEIDGTAVESATGADGTISYTFSNTGSTVRRQQVTLVSTCSIGGEQVGQIRNTMSVEVYPVPVVTINAPLREIFNGHSFSYTAEVNGGFSTSYSWTVDGQSAGTNSDTYTYTGTCPADASQTHTVAVTVTCTLAGQSVSVEAETTVTVYPRPTVTVSGDVASFSGQSVRFDAAVSGGVPQGRTYQWTLDGNTVGTASSVTVSPTNTTDGMIAYTYHLTVTDNLGGGQTATARADVTLNVWPTPHTELVNVNNTPSVVYAGTGVSLSVRSSGGAPGNWSYQWTNNGENVGNGADYSFTASASGSEASRYTVTVRVENRPAGISETNAYTGTYTFDVEVWAYPYVTGQSPYDNAGAAGDNETLYVFVLGGMPGTWSFVWTCNGVEIPGAQGSMYDFTYPSVSAERRDYYTVRAINTLNGVTVVDVLCDFGVYCYPAITAPAPGSGDAIRLSTYSVRKDNTVRATLNPGASGGASWYYYWTFMGNELYDAGNYVDFTAGMSGSQSMSTEQGDVSLSLSNQSANGITIFSGHYTSMPLTIYNSPELPDRLLRKGNGTTCTMIVEMPLSDERLAALDYRYIFGYTDAAGADHQLAQTNLRYQRFEPGVYNNSSNRFWVVAVWNYADGAIVTSGKRYLDGTTDTSYDGSLFGGRGGDSAIGEVTVAEGEIVCGATGFKASVAMPETAFCEIYTLGGQLVARNTYDAASTFDEAYPVENLCAGLYVARIQIGESLCKTVKIAVR